MAVGNGLRVLLRLHGRRDRPVDAVSVPRSHPDFSVDRQARLQPHHRPGGRGHQAHAASSTPPRPTSRSSSITCPAAATRRTSRRRNGSTSSRASSTWAGTPCASRSSPTRSGSASFPPTAQAHRRGPTSLPKWDTLSADEKKLFARQAEVFAAYTAYTDHEIGRVIQAVEDMGKLDNTLIIYIGGDNGTSPEGTLLGTPNQFTAYNGILDVPVEEQLKFYDTWGSAGDLSAHGGGLVVGVRHAVQVDQAGGVAFRRHAAGPGDLLAGPHQGRRRHPHASSTTSSTSCRPSSRPPASRRRELVNGIKQKPIEGVSMAYTFDKANANAPSTRNDAVLRDGRQPRHLPRRLVRQHHAAGAAVGAERADAGRRTTTSGSSTTSPRTTRRPTTWRRRCPTS